MKAAEEHLLIFERHFSAEKLCRPPSGWGIMPSAYFSVPLPRGLVEGASAGQHVAAGAAWVDLPQANPSGRAERERASQYPQRSRPSKQRHNDERREPRRSLRSSPEDETVGRRRGKNRQMALALRVAEIQAKGHKAFGFVAWHGGQLCWLRGLLARPLLRIRYGSPLRGCAREAALPAAHSSRNGLYVI
jgi:hypothetical protein